MNTQVTIHAHCQLSFQRVWGIPRGTVQALPCWLIEIRYPKPDCFQGSRTAVDTVITLASDKCELPNYKTENPVIDFRHEFGLSLIRRVAEEIPIMLSLADELRRDGRPLRPVTPFALLSLPCSPCSPLWDAAKRVLDSTGQGIAMRVVNSQLYYLDQMTRPQSASVYGVKCDNCGHFEDSCVWLPNGDQCPNCPRLAMMPLTREERQ